MEVSEQDVRDAHHDVGLQEVVLQSRKQFYYKEKVQLMMRQVWHALSGTGI